MSHTTDIPRIHPAQLPSRMALLHRLAFYPVLVGQGPFVKVRTPRLPEPVGAREGVSGHGPDLRLLVLGDSSACGVGVATQDQALTGQLVARLGLHAKVHWKLVAKTGDTTPMALRRVQEAAPGAADVAVIGLGVNDITSGTPVHRWLRHTGDLISHLAHDLGVQRIYVSGVPAVSQFPRLPNPLRWTLGHQAERYDRRLREFLSDRPEAVHIPAKMRLGPHNMAEDGYHPGPKVYGRWARIISEQVIADHQL